MKRILVSILMMLYMAGAMGATVHLHYCMGEFVDASLLHEEDHNCTKCGMVKKTGKNGCCQDEHKTFKTADHYKVSSAPIVLSQSVALVPSGVWYTNHEQQRYRCVACTTAQAHAPPDDIGSVPIYLKIRNLRI